MQKRNFLIVRFIGIEERGEEGGKILQHLN